MNRPVKKVMGILLSLAMVISLLPAVALPARAAADTWDGTVDAGWYTANPLAASFTINTAEQLAGLALIVNGDSDSDTFAGDTVTLAADLDLSGYNWMPIGLDSKPFQGTFDGGNHTIAGLTITGDAHAHSGLFGYVFTGGTIKNLTLADVDINSSRSGPETSVGGVVGKVNNGTVENCSVIGSVTGFLCVGGVVGYSAGLDGAVEGCYAAVDVTGTDSYVGGVVGMSDATIENCWATGDVESGGGSIGGVVGAGTTVTNCYATGNVVSTGPASASNCIGGVAGYGDNVQNCYATGDVSSAEGEAVGGVVGMSADGTVENCWATGDVSGINFVGGIVGVSWVTIYNSAALNTSVSGTSAVGRVTGADCSLSDNVAFSGMMITEGGSPKEISETNTDYKIDGADKTKGELQEVEGFPDALISDRAWTYVPGSLPGLGGETVEMPLHLLLDPKAPTISGPASLTLSPGYAATSTGAFTLTGKPAPTVTKTSGDEKITWNALTKKLDIAAGLTNGSYPVTLTASNGYGVDATHTFTLTVETVPPANDAPTLSATGSNPAYIENGSAVRLFSNVSVSAVETGQTIIALTLTVSNIANSENEILWIDGIGVALTNGNSLTTEANGMACSVSVSGSTATVRLSNAGGIMASAMEALVDGITYQNTSEAPTGANRVVTLTSIQGNGGGVDTASLSISSTVTLTAVNDAPTLSGGPYTLAGTSEDATSAGTSVSAILAGLTSQDADGNTLGIAVTAAAGNGTWQYSTDGNSWNDVDTVSGSAALLLSPATQIRYLPDGANGETATLTFRAWDQTEGSASTNSTRNTENTTANGGSTPFSMAAGTANLIVSSVNDAPVLMPATPSFTGLTASQTNNPGEPVSSFVGAAISDVDTGALKGIAMVATADGGGKWQFSTDNGSTWTNVGAVSGSNALLLRSTDCVRFVPDGVDAATASITYRAWDQTSGYQGNKVDVTTNGGTTAFSVATDTVSIAVAADAWVIDVSSTTPDGTYKAGDAITITVRFDKAVTVSGTPYLVLTLNSGERQAAYVSSSESTSLTFSYTVQPGDSDTDGVALTRLELNGGSIKNTAGKDASTALSNVGDTSGILVDGIAPTVSGILRQSPTSAQTNATAVTFRVTFSEPVKNVSTDDFALMASGSVSGRIDSVSASAGSVIDVSVSDISGGGTLGLNLNSGSGITDNAGNAMAGGYSSSEAYTIGATAPPPVDGGVTVDSGATVIVNGQSQTAGTSATNTNASGQTVTTVTVDTGRLENILASQGSGATVTIPVTSGSNVAAGTLTGAMVKSMEGKDATLILQTNSGSYTLPASEINIGAISAQLGASVSLADISVTVSVAEPSAPMAQIVENAAAKGGYTIIAPAVDFTITCTYGGQTVRVASFNAYVERTIAIPDGVDPAKITTGIVVNPGGTVRHVPTSVRRIDGKYYAVINSLTNSTYSVVWNPVTFSDVTDHWAKDAINNMGSRMIVTGDGNGSYAPARSMTRAEFAAIIVRALGLEPGTSASGFSDVVSADWCSGYVKTAAAYGIIKGYDGGSFRPNDAITREQAMTMLARAMKITGLGTGLTDGETGKLLEAYSDGPTISTYAQDSIAACLKTGITSGTSATTLSPKAAITRAEVAVMVQRLLQKSGLI